MSTLAAATIYSENCSNKES